LESKDLGFDIRIAPAAREANVKSASLATIGPAPHADEAVTDYCTAGKDNDSIAEKSGEPPPAVRRKQ
jgi:hypothetical protein